MLEGPPDKMIPSGFRSRKASLEIDDQYHGRPLPGRALAAAFRTGMSHLTVCENRVNMLDKAAKVNRYLVAMIIQVYEIQTPEEAEAVIALGVDHVGSVVLEVGAWKQPTVRETVDLVGRLGGVSCLIPLFNRIDTVLSALDYYQPAIVHFCDNLLRGASGQQMTGGLTDLQKRVRQCFPDIKIMRSIPIRRPGAPGGSDEFQLRMVREFEPLSDFFLTDTLLGNKPQATPQDQPVSGFIGITGQTCDWTAVKRLVDATNLPVILAGGLSPANVYDGIMQTHPAGVDSCTGTNAVGSGGNPIRFRKDLKRVKRFVAEARRAQTDLEVARHESGIRESWGKSRAGTGEN
jgi:phosphoribosylanthranilate isomerase